MWEDKANIDGGKWVCFMVRWSFFLKFGEVVQCSSKEQTNILMIKVVLAIIGEQLDYGEDICGVVLSVRPKGDTINIWNRCGNDAGIISTTTAQLMQIVSDAPVKYQAHREAITYNKSFHAKSPKTFQGAGYQHQSAHLKTSTEDITFNGATPNSLSSSLGLRGHSMLKGSPPFLDLDSEFKQKTDPEREHIDLKSKASLDSVKDYWAEPPMAMDEKPLHHRHRDKQHKKSKSMSIVDESCDYPAYSIPMHLRKIEASAIPPIIPPILPPLSILPQPQPSLIQQNTPPLTSTSFRKQHRKSASVSVESPVSSHTKTHSRTPSSDAARKHSSRSPLLTSSSALNSAAMALNNYPARISKSRLSPTLTPIDFKRANGNQMVAHGPRHRDVEGHVESASVMGSRPPSSRLRRTSVDECIVDDVVVKELLGGVDEEDYEVDDQFKPRAFVPVVRRPSLKDDQTKAIKRRLGNRKDSHRFQSDARVKKPSRKILLDTTGFLWEHLPLFGMLLGICLITIALQRW